MTRALKAIGGTVLLREDEFLTFLAQGADLLNTHPVSRCTREDLHNALTPNHFLIGRAEAWLRDGSIGPQLGERHRYLQRTMEQLWKRFLGGVLPESRAREKCHTPSENLEVGDLVLVLKPGLHYQKCELGVVGKVQTGTDNLI
jgi:Family of unknown function (DUF5641)